MKMLIDGIGIVPGESEGRMTNLSPFPLESAEYVAGGRDCATVEIVLKKKLVIGLLKMHGQSLPQC